MEPQKTYIGDGVYASFDGYEFTLETERMENGRNWMVLGPYEMEALFKFVDSFARKEAQPEVE